MSAVLEVNPDVERYVARLQSLYSSVENWLRQRDPDATFTVGEVELNERRTQRYVAPELTVRLAGRPEIRLIPKGIFMVGAQGRVDVQSELGREILVWVADDGAGFPSGISGDPPPFTWPIYPDVPSGWAWSDADRNRLLHLTAEVFWDQVVVSLTE